MKLITNVIPRGLQRIGYFSFSLIPTFLWGEAAPAKVEAKPAAVSAETKPAEPAPAASAKPETTPASAAAAEAIDVLALLKGNLVKFSKKSDADKGEMVPDDQSHEATKYFGLYFSAYWCPMCKNFTPKLVEFYPKYREQHPEFEVIFVSNDRNEAQMLQHMEARKMPWSAMRYDTKSKPEIYQKLYKYAGPGMPCLVVIDPKGKVIFDSYQNGTYRGAETVLKDLEGLPAPK